MLLEENEEDSIEPKIREGWERQKKEGVLRGKIRRGRRRYALGWEWRWFQRTEKLRRMKKTKEGGRW